MTKLKFKEGHAKVVDHDGDRIGFTLDKRAPIPLVISVNGEVGGLTRGQAIHLALAIIKEFSL